LRLEKFLVNCGVGSRKDIKKIVGEGRVKINGLVTLNFGLWIEEDTDNITLDNRHLEFKTMRYYILYKTKGYITAVKDERHPTIMELLPDWLDTKDLFPVGRLDKDTEGLLLFTNDGDTSYKMTHPDKKISKKYYVELDKPISEGDIKELENGIDIGTHICLPAKVQYIEQNKIFLTIQEGKYHQVKKMVGATKNKVSYLKRVKFGNLTLEDMKPGELKEIFLNDIFDYVNK
jgi:16S rRNA pseudouridine516 synthase